jgi:thymidine kinase
VKLYYRYGTMDSSKTMRLLADAYEYYQRGEFALLLKPTTDTRSSQGKIESRAGLSAPCLDIDKKFNIYNYIQSVTSKQEVSCILVDEAQFLTTQQVIHLRLIADNLGIPVMCYGLRTDFMGNFFEGSSALFQHANSLEEVKTMCREKGCKSKAMYNGRFINGKPVFEGETVAVGDTKETENGHYYIPKCSRHFFMDFAKFNAEKGKK